MLRRLGLLAGDLGRYDEAAAYLSTAASLYARLGDRRRHAKAVNSLGVTHLRRGDIDAAISRLSEALSIRRELGDTRRVALVLIDLGDALTEAGRADEALRCLAEAEDGLRDSPDMYSRARLRMLTGRARGRLGRDPLRARADLDEAIEAMEALVSAAGRIEALGYRGELAEREGATDDAASYYGQAGALLDQLGTPTGGWLRRRISALSPLAARTVPGDPAAESDRHRRAAGK